MLLVVVRAEVLEEAKDRFENRGKEQPKQFKPLSLTHTLHCERVTVWESLSLGQTAVLTEDHMDGLKVPHSVIRVSQTSQIEEFHYYLETYR